jgi:hypothetical protein
MVSHAAAEDMVRLMDAGMPAPLVLDLPDLFETALS